MRLVCEKRTVLVKINLYLITLLYTRMKPHLTLRPYISELTYNLHKLDNDRDRAHKKNNRKK